jgi:hypothetical protein
MLLVLLRFAAYMFFHGSSMLPQNSCMLLLSSSIKQLLDTKYKGVL